MIQIWSDVNLHLGICFSKCFWWCHVIRLTCHSTFWSCPQKCDVLKVCQPTFSGAAAFRLSLLHIPLGISFVVAALPQQRSKLIAEWSLHYQGILGTIDLSSKIVSVTKRLWCFDTDSEVPTPPRKITLIKWKICVRFRPCFHTLDYPVEGTLGTTGITQVFPVPDLQTVKFLRALDS